ncbi:hypothetical protein WSM22_23280 [Cytophagales bacterium WSM2-2]|nr:hypothetical protein WSM22_23280 [Cytophagales bacterium WSM2-2]
MKSLLAIAVVCSFCVILFSCGNIINDKEYNLDSIRLAPQLAVPLAFGSLRIKDILNNADSQYVKVYSDGLVFLSYSQTLKSADIRNLVTMPNQSLTRTFALPAGILPPTPKDFRSDSIVQVIDLGLTPEKLSEILFKSGTINYSTSLSPANPNFKYEIAIALPDFTSTATSTTFSQKVSGNGSFSLQNYDAVLNNNQFNLKLVLIIKQNPSAVTIVPGSTINMNISFTGMDFSYIKGFFGDQSVNVAPETLEIGTFNTSFDGANISFAQPKINFTVTNDYGVPLTVIFQTLEARKPGASLPVQINPVSPVQVATPSTLGGSAQTTVSVTNASQLLNFAPTQFYYAAGARINAGLSSANPLNFMADTSKFRVNLGVEVPLYGHASNIILADTAEIDLSDIDQSKIDKAFLKVKVSNEIPLDANVQFYLTDANYNLIDVLLTPSQTAIIPGSKVDANGDLLTPGVFDQLLEIDAARVNKVFTAKKIIIRGTVTTSKDANGNFPDVKFRSQYKMNVNLGLKANLKIAVGL